MQRRDFGKALIGGAVGAALGGLTDAAPAFGQPQKKLTPRRNTKMHVGADYHVMEGTTLTSKENLEYNLRFGVKSISPDPDQEAHRGKGGHFDAFIPAEGPVLGGAFDPDVLKQMKDNCDAVGMWLEALRMDSGYIILKDPSDQDRKLDQICDNVRKAAQVDVRIISYHWTMIPIRRNGTVPGRGDAVYSTFKLENDWKNLPAGMAGPVSYNEYWERIEKFLKRVIPVCAEYKVAMANHPYDPPGLPYGYEGAENFDSPSIYTAYKKYEQMVDSPWNGFQMDLGVIGEGSTDVNRTEPPLVQYMAERGKIKQVHMRNIKGGLNDFQEVYPDEGVIDFFKIMRIFRDTGYEGSFLPDHMPSSPGDPGKLQAYAFGYGYIHALIHSVNSEVS
jgi:mannonate dehydratase